LRHDASVSTEHYPDQLCFDHTCLPLCYRFDPGADDDGVTVLTPLSALNLLSIETLEWLIPGYLGEKVYWLLKSLPRSLRRELVPLPAFAEKCCQQLSWQQGGLLAQLAGVVERLAGMAVPDNAWRLDTLPPYLFCNIRLHDEQGQVLDQSRDLAMLQGKWLARAESQYQRAAREVLPQGPLKQWDFGELPEQVEFQQGGITLHGFPALTDRGDAVSVQVFDSRAQAERAHRLGLARLFRLAATKQVRYVKKNLPGITNLCLWFRFAGSCDDLQNDIVSTAILRVLGDETGAIRSREQFQTAITAGQGRLMSVANELCDVLRVILELYHQVRARLAEIASPVNAEAREDMEQQLAGLVFPGFMQATPARWLQYYPRYLKALLRRVEKLPQNPDRDQQRLVEVAQYWQPLMENRENMAASLATDSEWATLRWMIEEYRVSLFAQDLGTSFPVSRRRLEAQWQRVREENPETFGG
jgi:ATP-dependent helicase HrpA